MVRPSIKDVAAPRACRSGTVSNVLNQPSLVRPETRLGWSAPSRSSASSGTTRHASCAPGSSRTFAYVVLDAANPFFTDVARGIDEVARRLPAALFLCDSVQDAAREDHYLEQLAGATGQGHLHHRCRRPQSRGSAASREWGYR